MRFVRLFAVGVLVLVVAITPLSAVTASGHFEYRYPARDFDWFGHTVVVEDRTGLVAGIGPAQSTSHGTGTVTNIARSGNLLLVQWWAGGCETHSRLVFERVDAGYRIDVTSGGRMCMFLNLTGYALVMKLWSPVDAESVEFVSDV